MSFTIADVILLVLVLSFAIGGLMSGFIKALGGIIGFFAGLYIAGLYFTPFANWLSPMIGNHPDIAKIVAFIVILAIVSGIIRLIFNIINKVVGIIPFMKTINRLAGLVLGIVEGVLVTGLLIYIVMKFAPGVPFLHDNLIKSQVAHWLTNTFNYLGQWALPEVMGKITSIFK